MYINYLLSFNTPGNLPICIAKLVLCRRELKILCRCQYERLSFLSLNSASYFSRCSFLKSIGFLRSQEYNNNKRQFYYPEVFLQFYITRGIRVNYSVPGGCRDGVSFESGSSCVILGTLKMILNAAMSCKLYKVGGMPQPVNRRNPLSCTIWASRQKSCNQRVGCL